MSIDFVVINIKTSSYFVVDETRDITIWRQQGFSHGCVKDTNRVYVCARASTELEGLKNAGSIPTFLHIPLELCVYLFPGVRSPSSGPFCGKSKPPFELHLIRSLLRFLWKRNSPCDSLREKFSWTLGGDFEWSNIQTSLENSFYVCRKLKRRLHYDDDDHDHDHDHDDVDDDDDDDDDDEVDEVDEENGYDNTLLHAIVRNAMLSTLGSSYETWKIVKSDLKIFVLLYGKRRRGERGENDWEEVLRLITSQHVPRDMSA
ncbi:hypothetical protein HZH66_009352 [Vespula vulgaris]|uniref:Uncharacterized protein n=1 Tax=Vespula vulgaris TaxID=7454 RepID=A0A834MZH4_VESVU|nr:hypothetical protein HZH66_009352 [Vespula vulgaris]